MPYNAIPLPYRKFFRSPNAPRFDRFNKQDSFIAWIDILGVQRMPHQEIVNAVKTALEIAAECSANGPVIGIGNPPYDVLVGTPQSTAQYTLVGDALLMVEKHTPETQAAATLGFLDRVCLVSRILFESDLIHRGVLTKGAVFCDRFDDASIITGAGVVKAYGLESKLDVAGLFYDDTLTPFIQQRSSQIRRHNWYEPFSGLTNWNYQQLAPNLVGTIFSQYSGWELWKQAIANGNSSFSKVSNASSLIRELQQTRGLP